MDIVERVKAFISSNFYVSDVEALPDDASLISLGVVDSTGVLEIISFIEQEFAIVVEDHDATAGNLESIARIAAFVARKAARSEPLQAAAGN